MTRKIPMTKEARALRQRGSRVHSLRHWPLVIGRFLLLFALALCATTASAIVITRTSSPIFYTDLGETPKRECMYVSYQINNNDGVNYNSVWVTIGSFTGGIVGLAPTEDGVVNLGSLANGQTKAAFFYLRATANTTVDQGHTITVYNGPPAFGPSLGSGTFVFTDVVDTIKANANKVTTVVTGPTPPELGGLVTISVEGDSGTIGSGNVMSFSGAVLASWPANAYEMFASSITLSSGSSGTFSNTLLIPPASLGGSAHYASTYYLRAVGATVAPTTVSPTAYISSGANVKHTDNDPATLPPIGPTDNHMLLGKTSTPAQLFNGGTVTYTLTLTNGGAQAVSLDTFVDTLPSVPASASYVAGSSTFNGAAIANPNISGQVLTWFGTFQVPAGSARALVFQATLPATNGTFTNAAIATVGPAQIDATLGISDNAPARATNLVTIVTLSGTVFEDVNYGGGAGRNRTTAGGVVRPNARVELFDVAGNFLRFTNTDASGNYTFVPSVGTTNTVRVANSSVTSSRPNAAAGLLPVQTFRTDASSGAAVDVTDRVGGEVPHKVDAGNGSTTLAALSNATTCAQSVATVKIGSNSLAGVDFGFNFDTIVNTNDTGQGSFRQFIVNANTLGNGGLAQVGQTAGKEVSLFMISDGAAHSGLRAGLANQLAGGVARIAVASTLPAFSVTDGNDTTVDGTTQTANVSDSNSGQLGVGGTVGVGGVTLPRVNRPEVEIVDNGGLAMGFDIDAANITVKGIAIYGFGNNVDANGQTNLRIRSGRAGARIEACIVGASAASFTDPGVAARSGGDNIRSQGDGVVITNNLIGFSAGKGVNLVSASALCRVEGNEIRGNGLSDPAMPGLTPNNGTADVIRGNLFTANQGAGIDFSGSGSGAYSITENTVSGNGVGSGGGLVTAGIRTFGTAATTLARNIITANVGAGVMVTSGARNHTISQNSIYGNGPANGQIGIDLLKAADDARTGTSPFVTLNDSGDSDSGGNAALNFPVVVSATIFSGNLTLQGFARPGAAIELFIAEPDPSGFGEGRTYLTTLTEGSGADADAGTGSYSGLINGLDQGSDTTARFSFTIAVPGGVAAGTRLTATATLAGETSEFSGNVTVTAAINVSGFVYADANHNLQKDGSETGAGLSLFAKIVSATNAAGPALLAVPVNGASGAYTLTNVASGTYHILIDNNNTLADVIPTIPAGWTGTEMPSQVRSNVAVASVDVPNQNFGLINALGLNGKVFKDTGAGGGTANDGVPNGSESGLANVTVKLTDNTGATVYDTATTDGAGNYTLLVPNSVANGATLKVVEVNPANHVSTGAGLGNSGGSYNRATDTVTFTYAAGTVYTGVNFGDVPDNAFLTDGQDAGLPGTFVVFPHMFTAGSGGAVTFSVASAPSPAISGWSQVLYRDANCNGKLDAGEPVINGAITVTAGEQVCLVVKEFIPATAPYNAQDQLSVTAAFTYTGASPALATNYTRTDLATVGNPTTASLTLVKAVDKATALPGEVLGYTVTYANNSSASLTNIVIFDETPAFTTFTSASNGALPASLTGVSITAPSVGGTGAIRWTFTGSLAPSKSGTVTFSVTVAQ